MIGAIETRYKGYNFRSRLEARWAVFFDSLGIEWQYEPQGFQVDDVLYLPDFWLPVSQTWVEVKGSDEALAVDQNRLEDVLDFGSPLPGVTESLGTTRGLLLLGPIPEHRFGMVLHPIIQHHKGLSISWASFFSKEEPLLMGPASLDWIHQLIGFPEQDHCPGKWSALPKYVRSELAIGPVLAGYEAARSARFEHGRAG